MGLPNQIKNKIKDFIYDHPKFHVELYHDYVVFYSIKIDWSILSDKEYEKLMKKRVSMELEIYPDELLQYFIEEFGGTCFNNLE